MRWEFPHIPKIDFPSVVISGYYAGDSQHYMRLFTIFYLIYYMLWKFSKNADEHMEFGTRT